VTDRGDPPADPRLAFVVVTTVKPDGRKIHYYEWPKGPPEAGKPAKPEPPKAPRAAHRRV
jgi:hypothetical protein